MVMSILAFASPATSELIEADLAAPGDALITRDTETGLDWLDLTETTGLSYDDVGAGSGNTWAANGWRHATTPEVCDLLLKLGLGPTPCPGSVSVEGDFVSNHLTLLGVNGMQIGTASTWGLFDDLDPSNPSVGRGIVKKVGLDPPLTSTVDVWLNDSDPSISGSQFGGHFLVRRTSPGTVLTFDANVAPPGTNRSQISQSYGDRVTEPHDTANNFHYLGEADTPNAVAEYSEPTLLWDDDYGNLTNVVYPGEVGGGGILELKLTADPGHLVQLYGFDLAGWSSGGGENYTINAVQVLDVAGGLLHNESNKLILGANDDHTSFDFDPPLESAEVTIRFDSSNLGTLQDNIGLDNVDFDQLPAQTATTELLYWTEQGTTRQIRSLQDGVITDVLSFGPDETPEGITVSSGDQKIYWNVCATGVQGAGDRIQRANLDGTSPETLFTGDAYGFNGLEGIALNERTHEVCWTDPGSFNAAISCADMDGDPAPKRNLGPGAESFGVAVDAIEEYLYLAATDETNPALPIASIQRRDFEDGGNLVDLFVEPAVDDPQDVAIDPNSQRIYWSDRLLGTIAWGQLDGTGSPMALVSGLTDPRGLALDVPAQEVYWADWTDGAIYRASIADPENYEAIVVGLDNPQGLALFIPECRDGIDNDGDGLADDAEDPGCVDQEDLSERDAALPCDDGLDNEPTPDGMIDYPDDPGCASPTHFSESPRCQDGLDNEIGPKDGLIDFDGGASAGVPPAQQTAPDPGCLGKASRNSENSPNFCGLGAELVLLLPPLLWLPRRWRRLH